MNKNSISFEEASLLLKRLITDRIKVTALLMSSDGSSKVKLDGFVDSISAKLGLVITDAPSGPPSSGNAFIIVNDLAGTTFEYTDDSEVPAELPVGSGLLLKIPNGSLLFLTEIRDKSS